MRITVLGGSGAYPVAGQGCGGYVVEHEDLMVLLDPGYATIGPFLERWRAEQVDAVVVTHGHPDHCADLHPLLRMRAFDARQLPPLPLYAPPGALDAVLALDSPDVLDGAFTTHAFRPGDTLSIGALRIDTVLLPHFLPNAGLRITDGRRSLSYTGDCGPSADLNDFVAGTDLLLAEATYAERVPAQHSGHLSTAREVGVTASVARVGELWLTHLWPGSDAQAHMSAAAAVYAGPLAVARPGLARDLN